MNNEIVVAIIGAVSGALSGGIVTLVLDLLREKRKDKKDKLKLRKKIYNNRPEFKIVEYKDYITRKGYGIKQQCDLNVFVACIDNVVVNDDVIVQFEKKDFNEKEWCSVIYTFENIGKTDISHLYIIGTHQRNAVIYDMKCAKEMSEKGIVNYSQPLDKKIRQGEKFTLKICYHNERIYSGMISAAFCIGIADCNGRYWVQPLFAPHDKLYDSYAISYKDFREEILPDKAIECFKRPWLW